ncbi:hypothetical protein [Microbacterium sulfonylureivorans]|uniref:hypothetical protein n=1 Tax=Microbacterium sulfonylureivorans TaxID=2486854 RepID=UPI000FDC7EFA|nr:hypothetical protein [Microbacterium sulfonylureivorans]
MTTTLTTVLQRRFSLSDELYVDLVAGLPPGALARRLGELPSNAIGAQLWCVLGARESYVRAARAGGWQGFTSPVTAAEATDAAALHSAFVTTSATVAGFLDELDADDEQALTYALALLEHETQHHGQLIRYLYGLGMARPSSWQRRYALDGD